MDSLPQHPELPPKSRWRAQRDCDGFEFRFHDESQLTSFYGTFPVAALFIGIASIFMLHLSGVFVLNSTAQPKVGEWWFMFFLSIPFVLCGLCFAYGTIYCFLRYFHRKSWLFSGDLASSRASWRWLKWIKYYDLTDLHSLSVRFSDTRVETLELLAGSLPDEIEERYGDGECWELAFLDAVGADIVVIKNLRRPEALWMADVVLRERRTIR